MIDQATEWEATKAKESLDDVRRDLKNDPRHG